MTPNFLSPVASSSFISDSFEMRSDSDHIKQLALLNGPISDHYSKTYGINRRSCLLDVKHFSLFSGGLPHDAMHDILEGIASHHIKDLFFTVL